MIRRLHYIIYFLCVVSAEIVCAQKSTINDSLLIDRYLDKASYLQQLDTDSSFWYASEAYKIAQESNNLYLKGQTSLGLAMIYQNKTEYKTAAQYYKEGITYAEKLNNKPLLAQAYNGFGNLFGIQKQMAQAAEYFNKALVLSKEIKDNRKVSVILMNLANIEYSYAYASNNYIKVNKAYSEAYSWAIAAQDTGQQITCLGNWGMSYGDEGKFDLSIEKLNKAIELATKVNYRSDLISLHHYLGRTYGFMKQHQKALEAFTKSVGLAKVFKDVDYESENYYCLAETNYEMGNYKLAYDFFERYKNIEDTISNNEITTELNNIKVKYDTEKKQKEIELLKVSANKDRIVKISLMAGGVLLLVLAFLMFNRYRLKEKTNKLLEHQNSIISEKNKDISDSINYAKKIQDAILPSIMDIKKVFPDSFVLSIPKDVVSGDFYWFAQKDHLKLFIIADCTGHGVPGAFMSMIGNILLNNIVNERKIHRPDLILNELRKEIIKSLKQGEGSSSKDGMDISLICLNTENGNLEIACANNPIWILKNDGLLMEIKPDKQPIGYASANHKEFTLQSVVLEKGEVIYQFTDGYADQFGGEKGKKFKYNQLKELLLNIKNTPLERQEEVLRERFVEWKVNLDQVDDVLVSGICYL
ncbi:MAG: tetratricopeptide repeat protein [Bacteroidota bacterium]